MPLLMPERFGQRKDGHKMELLVEEEFCPSKMYVKQECAFIGVSVWKLDGIPQMTADKNKGMTISKDEYLRYFLNPSIGIDILYFLNLIAVYYF